MMRFETKVRALVAVLAVLLLAWGLGEFFAPERVSRRSETVTLLSGKTAEVARIDIAAGGSALRLEKSGGQWALADGADRLPVLTSRVDALLSSLAKAGRKRPVASKKEAWAGLGLDEGKVRSLTLSDAAGKPLLELHAGNYGTTGSELYARFGQGEASFTIDSTVSSWLSPDRSAWLDKRLWRTAVEAVAVQAVAVRADISLVAEGKDAAKPPLRAAWRFERSGQDWKGGQRLPDSVSVESMLRALLNLEAVDLAARAPADAFAKVAATVTLELGSGKSRLLEVGQPAGSGRFWARASEDGKLLPLVFQLSSYSLGTFLKDESAFVKK